ncbi:hypothetical protein ACOSP7_029442 [Xanthoceras sorbifolium]|uniref:Avr9/Cf-9 rapidly elicited protein 137 n=1 Tax=Xanthoceras sorbifolium TaxID=99658 RepID=A0ABQ8HB44_9ROSI|nr:hypothetical protein JRO89_XS12G0047800 [Xanthoceras sorbifolium]
MSWLSGGRKTRNFFRLQDKPTPLTLGILSFEAAKTMSRLISMYASLSDDEFANLREGAIKSRGVAFLNSNDETFLLNVACAEKIEDLNRAVGTVCRLSQKCTDEGLLRFDQVYTEMNLGILDLSSIELFDSKVVLKLIDKMERYVGATSNLHAALATLAELEVSERKLKQWKQNPGPKLANRTNVDYFIEKITFQRKQVKYYRDISLWNQTFDQIVALMARIVCIIYARICVVFGPFVPGLPRLSNKVKPNNLQQKISRMRVHPADTSYCLIQGRYEYKSCISKSGPIPQPSRNIGGASQVTKSSPLPKSEESGLINWSPLYIGKSKRAHQLATESMVGGAGLAARYANIITQAECYLHASTNINEEARAHMYEMLPENLKATVRGKLWGHWYTRLVEEESSSSCRSLAKGWRDALEDMMTWLGPVAHDTLKWQQERNLEKQRFDVKPTVSLFQTLYFSDLEKTEVAIVEVLVGLSCIYRYENKRPAGPRPGDPCS